MIRVSHPQMMQRSGKCQTALRTFLLLGLSLVVFILVSAGTSTAGADDPKQLFFDGFELLKAGKAKAAATKLEQGLKQEPNNAQAHFYLGEAYRHLKQVTKARQQYEAVLKADANSPVAAQARERLAALADTNEPGTAPTKLSGTRTMREAVQFIADYLTGCGDFHRTDTPAPPYEHLLFTRHYQWEDFSLTGKQLRFTEWTEDYVYNTTRPEKTSDPYFPIRDRVVTDVSALSPDVKVMQGRGEVWVAVLECTSGSCLQSKSAFFDPALSIGEAKSSKPIIEKGQKTLNRYAIEVCGDKEDANRISRALSHLIILGGGKKSPF